MEQRLVRTDEIQVGDEIIISAHSELKYLRVLRLPVKQDSATFKVSIRRDETGYVNCKWMINRFEQDVEKHNHIMYQNLAGRDIFLVKRENNI